MKRGIKPNEMTKLLINFHCENSYHLDMLCCVSALQKHEPQFNFHRKTRIYTDNISTVIPRSYFVGCNQTGDKSRKQIPPHMQCLNAEAGSRQSILIKKEKIYIYITTKDMKSDTQMTISDGGTSS